MSPDIKQTASETVAGLQIVANQPTTIHAEHGARLVDDLYAIVGYHHARRFTPKASHLKALLSQRKPRAVLVKLLCSLRPQFQ